MAVTQRKQIWRSAPEFDLPEVRGMPSAESDFLPELHRSRSAQGMTVFRRGDARQEEQHRRREAKKKLKRRRRRRRDAGGAGPPGS